MGWSRWPTYRRHGERRPAARRVPAPGSPARGGRALSQLRGPTGRSPQAFVDSADEREVLEAFLGTVRLGSSRTSMQRDRLPLHTSVCRPGGMPLEGGTRREKQGSAKRRKRWSTRGGFQVSRGRPPGFGRSTYMVVRHTVHPCNGSARRHCSSTRGFGVDSKMRS